MKAANQGGEFCRRHFVVPDIRGCELRRQAEGRVCFGHRCPRLFCFRGIIPFERIDLPFDHAPNILNIRGAEDGLCTDQTGGCNQDRPDRNNLTNGSQAQWFSVWNASGPAASRSRASNEPNKKKSRPGGRLSLKQGGVKRRDEDP